MITEKSSGEILLTFRAFSHIIIFVVRGVLPGEQVAACFRSQQ